MLIRKQSLIVGRALAALELSHKAVIEEWKLHITELHLNTFLVERSRGIYSAARFSRFWLLPLYKWSNPNIIIQDKLRLWEINTNLKVKLKWKCLFYFTVKVESCVKEKSQIYKFKSRSFLFFFSLFNKVFSVEEYKKQVLYIDFDNELTAVYSGLWIPAWFL